MDTLFLLFTLLVGFGTIALIRLLWTLIFHRPVSKNSRNSRADDPVYAASGKIGLAIVIANQYEGAERLNGTAKDKKQWEKVFVYLNFDVRTSETVGLNANRDEILRLCERLQRITIRPNDVSNYRYIAFVFSGHGYKDANRGDVIVSQDGEPLSLESEVFPRLFGGRRGDCIKLIFIDACRSDPSQEKLTLTKSHVEKAIEHGNPTVRVAPDLSTKDNVFIAFATLMGLPAGDTAKGSLFSSSFTKWLRKDIPLVSAMDEVIEEVIYSNTDHSFEFRPMSVNMLSCKVNLYRSAGKGWVSSVMECFKTLISWIRPDTDTQDPHPNQGQIPDPSVNQDPIQEPDPNPNLGQISDSDSSMDAENSSKTDESGYNGQDNSYPEPDLPLDNLLTNEGIQIPPPEPDGGVNQSPSQAVCKDPVRETLRSNWTYILNNLELEKVLLGECFEKNLIGRDQLQKIKAKETSTDKNDVFLDHAYSCWNEEYLLRFCKILENHTTTSPDRFRLIVERIYVTFKEKTGRHLSSVC